MGEIKVKCTIEPKDRPSYSEWAQQFRVSSLYVETSNGCITFSDAIQYAKSNMKNGSKQKGADNVWPNSTS
jgi:hypothetical protein